MTIVFVHKNKNREEGKSRVYNKNPGKGKLRVYNKNKGKGKGESHVCVCYQSQTPTIF